MKILYVYRSETMKNTQKRYRENHKEKIAEIQKRYYDKKKNDEEFKKKDHCFYFLFTFVKM